MNFVLEAQDTFQTRSASLNVANAAGIQSEMGTKSSLLDLPV